MDNSTNGSYNQVKYSKKRSEIGVIALSTHAPVLINQTVITGEGRKMQQLRELASKSRQEIGAMSSDEFQSIIQIRPALGKTPRDFHKEGR